MDDPTAGTRRRLVRNRWLQLTVGIIGMVAVANFQYAWTLFVGPLQEHGWTREEVLAALNLYFILAQTLLVPLEAYLAERFGPRRLLLAGGALAAAAWVINASTSSLLVLNLAQVLSGCGSGIVYGISMGNALKWFPDRRGLAAGLTAAAFGAGSAATILPIDWVIQSHGYRAAFLWFGLGQGLVVMLAGTIMAFPRVGEVPAVAPPAVLQTRGDTDPVDMLRTPAFWLLYLMMTLGAVPGLLMLGQLKPMAEDFGVAQALIFGTTAYQLALVLDRIMGGLTRPVFGWISDRIGRELAIFLAFGLEGGALLLLLLFRDSPAMFVAMSGVAFFGWGAVFSLFPALSGDMFGRRFASTNYGLLYTAKGASSLLVLGGNALRAWTGDWTVVFSVMIAADWLAALLAVGVLRPLRRRSAVPTA
ncbi:MAG: oxalate/formate MFS antiporter, partial [Gemmataceae bacterium]|nr:oxalate/formate MFS antiporter [Gemmataceae bacterium]MDW8264769.1 oxalate/formate MFS antiporter [Gemmataceae bacterium]